MVHPWVGLTVITAVAAATVAGTVTGWRGRRDRPPGRTVGIAAWVCVGWFFTLAVLGLVGPALLVFLVGLPVCGLAGLVVRDRRRRERRAAAACARAAGMPEAQVALAYRATPTDPAVVLACWLIAGLGWTLIVVGVLGILCFLGAAHPCQAVLDSCVWVATGPPAAGAVVHMFANTARRDPLIRAHLDDRAHRRTATRRPAAEG